MFAKKRFGSIKFRPKLTFVAEKKQFYSLSLFLDRFASHLLAVETTFGFILLPPLEVGKSLSLLWYIDPRLILVFFSSLVVNGQSDQILFCNKFFEQVFNDLQNKEPYEGAQFTTDFAKC